MAIRQANPVAETPAAEVKDQAPAAEAVVEEAQTSDAEPVAEAEVETVEVQAAAEPAAQVEDRAEASSAALDEVEDEPEPAPATTTAVATQTTSTSVSTNTSPVKGAFMQEILSGLEEEGFEGTTLDYSSFLNITMNKQIETSEGQELPNTGILVRLAGAKVKWCFRNNNPVEDEVEVAYSYDENADKDPESPVFAAIQKWKEEGLELGDKKKYQEVLAVMLDDAFGVETDNKGELNGKLITIQIPPTSQGRWAGYLTQLKMAKKNISDVKTLCRRGKKVESGKFPFYPWDFVNKGAVDTE